MTIKVSIRNPHSMLNSAIKLIEKLKSKNKIDFSLEIIYDYQLMEDNEPIKGVYYNDFKIYVNPSECETDPTKYSSCGYTNDLSLFGVTIHEFCHFLAEKIYPKMTSDYKKMFPTERFYLNDYSDYTLDDEIAEAMTLYITNPYLLKLISKDHWKFFRNYFLSPVPCTQKKFFAIYQTYHQIIKLDLQERWKISYNFEKNRFEKLKSIIK